MTREFEEFAEKASVSNEEVAMNSGVIWHSHRSDGPAGSYDAFLPAGLHISCGVANVRTFSKDLGGFEAQGPVANVVYVPEDGACFKTELSAGAVSSFGYYVPLDSLENDDGVIAGIAKVVRNRPLTPLVGEPLRAVPRFVSGAGSEYVGSSREMLLQSRALELCAMVSVTFGQNLQRQRSARIRRKMHDVLESIEERLSSAHRLDDLARQNGLSTRVMTAAFRETFGESIGGLVKRRRMEEGAAILEAGASVATAAAAVGYSPNAFTTAFTRHFGFPPSQLLNHKRRMA
ncbi:MAG: AraC family transcriptional regulator [Pseudomonadota bacterium]